VAPSGETNPSYPEAGGWKMQGGEQRNNNKFSSFVLVTAVSSTFAQ